VPEIARYVTADTLGYLSLEGMLEAVRETPSPRQLPQAPRSDEAGTSSGYCHACFSGQYAIPFVASTRKQMRLVGV
jgi:amidophosphoribosyltransferase